ncbi:hypothetical protein D1831_12860 [Lactiplantibacillus garii]|uniref:Serine-rich adhesin for platelets n=1 Tax=Lactiplantibacillus garii TaxID=2306423 RepID=A0A3R8KCR3_9LACO|nr:hypothetical protein [Lactiplantibacillus garii]RRK09410.1 hypothetical protein D1831_12860 [Lactiplantibacillus garii]
MSKKEKKAHFGKRLWDSITEPLPDDNDDQSNEQIPLAYDLKDSADSSADQPAKSAASTESSVAAASEAATAKSAKSTAPAKSQASSQAASHRSKRAAKSQAPTTASAAAKSAAPASAAKAKPEHDRNTIEIPDQPTSAVAPAPSRLSRSRAEAHGQSAESTATAAQAGRSTTAPNSTVSTTPRSAASQQPTIAVHATEDDEDQPELPLSREELYGDQQPNGGREPASHSAAAMSRVARHADQFEDEADDAPEENPHLKKKQPAGGNPHQKPGRSGHYSWKLMGTGVVILLIAAAGALFMWNRAKSTQADAKSNAETIVRAIYTSSAQRDLRTSASTDQLQQLQSSIDNMKDSSEKDSLQKQHDYAAQMLKVRTRYQKLRNTANLINVNVTSATITKDRQSIKTAGLTSSKTYFAKKYDKLFATTGKTVKKVTRYHAAFKKLYNKKGKLKSTTPSSQVDTVLSNLKTYRTKSQLAANDYRQLKADRKKLAKAASSSSSSSSYSSSSSSYSEPESSSSSSEYSSSEESSSSTYDNSSSTPTYYGNGGNDTQTSSAASSSSTTHYSSHSSSSTGTGNSTTGTGATTNQTTGGTTGNGTTTTDEDN